MFRPRPSCNYFVYTFSFFVLCQTWKLCFCCASCRLCLLFPSLSDFSCRCPFLCSTSPPPPLICCLSIQPLSVWSFFFLMIAIDMHTCMNDFLSSCHSTMLICLSFPFEYFGRSHTRSFFLMQR